MDHVYELNMGIFVFSNDWVLDLLMKVSIGSVGLTVLTCALRPCGHIIISVLPYLARLKPPGDHIFDQKELIQCVLLLTNNQF